MKLTAIIEKGENGWLVGQAEEIPAVMSQGKSVEELKANLIDALYLLIGQADSRSLLHHINA